MGEGSETLLGERATEAALTVKAPRTRILHLATHQVVDTSGAGSLSYLAFAQAEASNSGVARSQAMRPV